ncbi:MAG: hypothetical protein RMK79_00695 [Anaerolineae bacterium]|nr:hypothetical protein [Anaerolineae bacterium]
MRRVFEWQGIGAVVAVLVLPLLFFHKIICTNLILMGIDSVLYSTPIART